MFKKLITYNLKLKTKKQYFSYLPTSNYLRTTNKGFTILELLIVMTVIGVLAGIVLISFPAAQKRARDAQRRSDIKQYQTSAEIYANKSNGNYPNTGGNFANFCTALGLTGSLCVNDPGGGSYEVNSSTSAYQIWATLEDTPGGVQMYYVACSNGLSGDNDSEPAGSCPL